MAKELNPVGVIGLNPRKCKFSHCSSDADWFCFNPQIHYSPIGLCESCLERMKRGFPYTSSYYNCGRRKDIVEIEFRKDIPIQYELFGGGIDEIMV